jgi:hypothetical protein
MTGRTLINTKSLTVENKTEYKKRNAKSRRIVGKIRKDSWSG